MYLLLEPLNPLTCAKMPLKANSFVKSCHGHVVMFLVIFSRKIFQNMLRVAIWALVYFVRICWMTRTRVWDHKIS